MNNIYFVSGGKDSTAMLLHSLELGNKIDSVVFLDTTMEFQLLYNYLDAIDKEIEQYGLQIERRITAIHQFDERFYQVIKSGPHKGDIRGFPYAAFSRMCWIRREFKAFPKPAADDCHHIGIAYDERHRTKRKTYTEEIECVGCAPFADDCNTMTTQTSKHFKFPLIEWKLTEADCLEFLKQRGIVNQLYDHVTRIGCWLCPYQSKRSLSYLYTNHPQYWKQLLQYESDSPQGFLAKGKRLKELEASFEVDNKFKQSVLA